MLSTIFFIFLIGFAIVLFFAGLANVKLAKKKKKNKGKDDSINYRGIGALCIVGAVVCLLISLFSVVTIVPARNVGVAISFGKPVGVMSNGPHLKTPWTKVEKFPLTMQNDIYNGDHAIDVRLANSSRAKVDASIQWQLKPAGAEETYLNYKDFDSIRSNLVDRNFRAALNEELATFDPLSVVQDGAKEQKLAEFAERVKTNLDKKANDKIEVRSVTIPIVNFDDSTQRRIDDLVSEFANTRVAEQRKKTSEAEARANKALQESVSGDTLANKCLDIVRETKQSPLGCFPGNGAVPTIDTKR